MNRYFVFAKAYKRAFLFAPLLVIVDAVCEIVQPQLMSNIVDRGIEHKDLHYVYLIGGIMLGLSLVAIVANVGNIVFSSRASVGFATDLRRGLFDKIQQFSFSDIDKFKSASLVTRITNDVNVLQQVVMMSLRMLIKSPLMMLFAIVMAVRIDAGLTVVISVAIPVLAASIFFLLRRGLPFYVRMQEKLDQVNGSVQENIGNIRVVKAFVREDFEIKKFSLSNEELRDISIKASATVALINPVMQLVMNVSIVAIIAFGGERIMAGKLQIGQLISFISYMTQILMSLLMFSMTIMTFSRAAASSRRILEVLRLQPEMVDSPEAIRADYKVTKGRVEFNQVSFKYNPLSKEFVLKDIHFEVQPGERIAIVGATGSAKSTLVQLIPRLYDVSSGQVLVDGVDVKKYTLRNLRDGVAMVLQKNVLFSGTIADNLRWGNPHAAMADLVTAAQYAQAHDFIMSLPRQYDTMLGQGGVNLSGGQKQRLCIARAILKKPAILILDDSTSAVDTATEATIRTALDRYLGDMTILLIAQRISTIMTADKIIVLAGGEILAMGTHQELMTSCEAYQEIYQSQWQKEEAPL